MKTSEPDGVDAARADDDGDDDLEEDRNDDDDGPPRVGLVRTDLDPRLRRLWRRLRSIIIRRGRGTLTSGFGGGGGVGATAAVVALLVSIAFAYHRYRRRARMRMGGRTERLLENSTTPSSSSWFRLLLSNWLASRVPKGEGSVHSPRQDPRRRTKMRGDDAPPNASDAPVSLLMSAARSGSVRRALVNGTSCVFQLVGGSTTSSFPSPSPSPSPSPVEAGGGGWFKSSIPAGMDLSKIVSTLVDNGCTDVSDLPPSLASRLVAPAMAALPFAYLGLMYRMIKGLQDGQEGMLKGEGGKTGSTGAGAVGTRFDDVAGVDGAKMELMEVVRCLRDPSRYRAVGALPPRGVLLHGPSGTGKTLLARAVAGEAGRSDGDGDGDCDCRCAFMSCSASDFVEMLVGRGAARVRDLFDRARREARALHRRRRRRRDGGGGDGSPSAVIFIDEIDALAKCRTGGLHGNDEREQTLNQLLTEMDGFDSGGGSANDGERDGVTLVVLAATNRPEILDPALLRPGRFDRHVYVGCPDAAGREAILRLHGRRVKMDPTAVDLVELAGDGFTGGFSGADLANVVNESAFLAVRRGRGSVTQEHLVEAARRVSKMKVHLGTEHNFGSETAYDVF